MHILDIIEKKKRALELSDAEIDFMVKAVLDPNTPDYQLAALLMAIRINGMSDRETVRLTLDMAASGDELDLSMIEGVPVDKHSTGGVGDTTTLVLAPLAAACGAPVAKMSGRGLGFTGGTLDKLDSIPGFRNDLEPDEFIEIVQKVGCAVAGQSARLAPADKRLYALRDVTGTVDSLPLIVSSILSKKLAAGARAIVLDVKTGSGALMEREEDALRLARDMVRIGCQAGRRVSALVTDMNQPLGMYIGNALEVEEAVRVLRGEVRGQLLDVALSLGEMMLTAAGVCGDAASARTLMEDKLASGAALDKLRQMVAAQHGDPRVIDDLSMLPGCREKIAVPAPKSGWISSMRASDIGRASMVLGAGRESVGDVIDLGVGLVLTHRLGERIEQGEPLAILHVNDPRRVDEARALLMGAIDISDERTEPVPLIHARIEAKDVL